MPAQLPLWQGHYDKLFLGGRWATPASGQVLEVISPSTEEVVARVAQGAEADIDTAVAEIRHAVTALRR